jgi:hypothetical protein
MSTESQPFAFLDTAAIPQTTPRPERRRLAAKGQMLAEHCLDGGGTACVIGFVGHCLGKSPPQLDVVVDLWLHLCREQDQLSRSQEQPRYALLHELLQEVTSRLKNVMASVNGSESA